MYNEPFSKIILQKHVEGLLNLLSNSCQMNILDTQALPMFSKHHISCKSFLKWVAVQITKEAKSANQKSLCYFMLVWKGEKLMKMLSENSSTKATILGKKFVDVFTF